MAYRGGRSRSCDDSDGCLSVILEDLRLREGAALVKKKAQDARCPVQRFYGWFIRAAIAITLTFGTFWGVSILTKAAANKGFTAPDPAAVQAHAHAQVFGWIGLFIMGMAYVIYPRMKQAALRRPGLVGVSFCLMAGGIVLRAICQPFAADPFWADAVVVSAAMEVAAAVIFVRSIFLVFWDSAEPRHASDFFILGAMFWLCVALAINLGTMLEIARTGNPVVPEAINETRISAEVFGFIISMILGVGARLLPALGGYRDIKQSWGIAAALLYGVGVAIKTADISQSLGSGLMVVALVGYVASVGIFNRGSVAGHFPTLRTWVGIAYFWLLAGGLMMLGGDIYAGVSGQEAARVWIGAYRHAVTVGFVTTMVVGMALNTVPLIHGAPLFSWRLVKVSFWLLISGNAARVIFQALTLTGSLVAYGIAGMSGYLELAALACFGVNVVVTLSRPRSVAGFALSRLSPLSTYAKISR